MREGFSAKVNRIIESSDIVLEVVDARFPAETRNTALEKRIVAAGKELLIVLNKSDLVSVRKAKKIKQEIGKEFTCVFVSAREKTGKKKLLNAIGRLAGGRMIRVAVIGYPNTGKSSVINSLKGKKAALVSRKAGFTKGEQIVRVSEKILLIDSPGIIPVGGDDEFKLFLVGAKNPQDLEDQQLVALRLIEFLLRERPSALQKRYGVSGKNPEIILEEIALKRKKLLKGGLPDTGAAARILLEEWGSGTLN